MLISHCFVWTDSHFTVGVTRRLLLSSRVSLLVINLLTIREKVRVKYLFPLIQILCVDRFSRFKNKTKKVKFYLAFNFRLQLQVRAWGPYA